jgi:hypothetical protein
MKSDTVAVWFTFEGDALPLRESVAYFRSMNPGIPVYIAHDIARPIPLEIMDAISPEFIEETRFETKTALFGWKPLLAILETIQKACQLSGAKSAVKIDSDTMVDLSGWYSSDLPWVGAEGGLMPLGRGMACGIRPEVASSIYKSLTENRWFDKSFIPPEDSVIYSEAMRIFPDTKLWLRTKRKGALMVGYDWIDETEGFERYKESKVITFGNRMTLPKNREAASLLMAGRMREFREWRTGSKSPPIKPTPQPIHFLSIPKNASESVRSARVKGLSVHWHSENGSGLKGETIAVCRNPFERFESAVAYLKKLAPKIYQSAEIKGACDLAERLAIGDPKAMAIFTHQSENQNVGGEFVGCNYVFVPQNRWIKYATTIIKFEDFPEYFLKRFGVELPHINKSKPLEENWTASGKKWIRKFYADDFKD